MRAVRGMADGLGGETVVGIVTHRSPPQLVSPRGFLRPGFLLLRHIAEQVVLPLEPGEPLLPVHGGGLVKHAVDEPAERIVAVLARLAVGGDQDDGATGLVVAVTGEAIPIDDGLGAVQAVVGGLDNAPGAVGGFDAVPDEVVFILVNLTMGGFGGGLLVYCKPNIMRLLLELVLS